MSFLPAISGWSREPSGPYVRLHVFREGKYQDRRRLTFHFSRSLVEQLDWQAGDRMVVCIGVGSDLGGFLISKIDRPRTGVKLMPCSKQPRAFRIHLNLAPVVHGIRCSDLVDHLPLPAELSFEVEGGALQVRATGKPAITAHNRPNLTLVSLNARAANA